MYIFKNSLENKLRHMSMWLKKFMHVDNIIINLINPIFLPLEALFYVTKTPWTKQMTERMDYAYIYFISSFDYRKWSIKQRCAYFIILVIGAVLLRERCLIESSTYYNYQ